MGRWLRRLFRLTSRRRVQHPQHSVPAPVVPQPSSDGNLAEDTDADRRRWPRLQLQLDVRLRFSSTEAMVGCRTFDISPGGAFIVLENPRPEGTPVRLTIALGERALVLGGVVVRTSRGEDEPKGMGILFTEVSADDEAFIALLREPE